MPRFLIEREIPNAQDLTRDQLSQIARTSNDAADSLGVPYTWVTSYVAGDKIYCLHEADDAETVREHARRGGFPADVVAVVASEFGPHTADTVPVA
jgi:Nickel responsive protein SCO4226-like